MAGRIAFWCPVPARKTTDAAMIERRRPILSARRPPAIAPRIAPTSTELVAISSRVGGRANSLVMKRIAPDMTPVS